MQSLMRSRVILAGLLVFGGGVAPALAQMAPMGPMGPRAPGAGMSGGMEGKMPMPPPAAPATSAAMGVDGMAMPVPGAGAPGMPPAASPGMAGGMMQQMKPMMDMMMGQMAKMPPPAAPLDHVEGRIAYMKAELAVTDAQAPAWDKFALALRTSRGHLDEARTALVASKDVQNSVPNRLEAYEHHLSMRLDSLRSARESFQSLYASLSAAQKVTADELAAPLLASF